MTVTRMTTVPAHRTTGEPASGTADDEIRDIA